MKIWVIGRNVPTTYNRMNGSFELDQAKMLAEDNEVSYLALSFCFGPGRNNRTPGYFFRSAVDGCVKVFSRTCPCIPGRFAIHWRAYLDAQWMAFVRRVLKETGVPDVVHVHYPTMIGNVKAFTYLKSLGTKLVCTEHWTRVLTGEIDGYERGTLASLVGLSDAFICVGRPLADAVGRATAAESKAEIVLVPNAVSELFRPRSKRERSGDGFTFVAVGRLVPVKQFDEIVSAFSMAFQEDESVSLVIVGEGQERDRISRAVQERHLEGRVNLTGALERAEVARVVSDSDCLVCYSRLETFGVPVIEGWACGLPAISSDCLGFAEYWHEGLGEIVAHDDPEQLANAMRRVRNGYSSYDRDAISEFAISTFGNDTIRGQLTRIYQKCLDSSSVVEANCTTGSERR